MATRRKRGDGWQVLWREQSGKQRGRMCPDARTADTLIREIESVQSLGRDWRPEAPVARGGGPLAEVIAGFLRHRRAAGDAERTLEVKIYQLEVFTRWLEGAVGEAPAVEHLTRTRLEAYLLWLQEEGSGRHGRPRTLTTATHYVGLVERLWAWAHDTAEDQGWSVPRPKTVTPDVQREYPAWRDSPTWADADKAINEARGWLRLLLSVLRLTGLRVHQAMRLRRSDVDLVKGTLLIRGELGKSRSERAGRQIPASPHFIELVRQLEPAADGWLLPCGRKRRRVCQRDATVAWERAGVDPMKWKKRPHHAFRACFLSGLRLAGAPLDAVEVLVGHAPTPTARSYLNIDAFDLRAVVALVPPLGCDPLRHPSEVAQGEGA